ncbi:MAG: hypothetical protein EA398_02600 [Deltaproteobacteria bacterium]|nr:MAG: hypothetical protein EA398_02600 [Deltaproteobacteria bacterium]
MARSGIVPAWHRAEVRIRHHGGKHGGTRPWNAHRERFGGAFAAALRAGPPLPSGIDNLRRMNHAALHGPPGLLLIPLSAASPMIPRALALAVVLPALLLAAPFPAAASPDVVPPAQRAPVPGPVDLTVPGPGERLVPIPGTASIADPIERIATLLAHWTDVDGTPRLPFVDARIEGSSATIALAEAPLRALHDHDLELLLLAFFGALHDVAPEVRSLHLEAVTPEGHRLPEDVWRPRTAPLPDPALPDPGEGDLLPFRQGEGALAGRRIALSPGHGWTWTGSAWATQRSDSFGLIEDFLTATICREHVDPYLVAAGADVVWLRERSGELHAASTVDDGDPGYDEQGSGFGQGSAAGGFGDDYRFVNADNADAIITWQVPFAGDRVPVHAWWVPGANRADAALYRIHHRGGTTEVRRNQQRGGPHWQFLGHFSLDDDSRVELVGEDGAAGVLILDALRFGTLTGALRRNGNPSGHPGWQENSRNYAEFSGAPSAVYASRANERDSDIVARPLWSNRLQVDAYVSVHTNAAGGTGTETFMFNGNATAGSAGLRRSLQQQLVGDIRAYWNAQWTDRGEKAANFGELRELTNAPGALVEIAFHDRNPETGPDVPSLHDPRFRRIAGRAIARAVVRHFDASVPFVPEPPLDVRAINTAEGIEIRFDDDGAREGAGAATSWRVFLAFDDRPFDGGTVVEDNRFLVDTLAPGDVVHVRVAGRNAGGTGLPSRTVSARRGHGDAAGALLVNAYRRWDRSTGELGNTGDHLRRWTEALVAAEPEDTVLALDGATREAVAGGLPLPHDAILWQSGRDEGPFAALTEAEADRILAHLDAGGAFLLSGAHALADLHERLPQHGLTQLLDARATGRRAPRTLSGGGAFATSTDRTHYALPEVDTVAIQTPADGGLRWDDDATAALWRSADRIAFAAFPLEALLDRATRGDVLWTLLGALGVDGSPLPPPETDGFGDDSGSPTDSRPDPTDPGGTGDPGPPTTDTPPGTDPTDPGTSAGPIERPDPPEQDSPDAHRTAAIYGPDALPGEGPVTVQGCSASGGHPAGSALPLLLLLGLAATRRRRPA